MAKNKKNDEQINNPRSASAYQEWEAEWKAELRFWCSPTGRELQYCLVSQGYEHVLIERMIILSGSGFIVLGIIKYVREEVGDAR